MKKVWLGVLTVFSAFSSCKNAAIEKGEECSIKVSGIEFTKSLNGASSLTTIADEKLLIKSRAKSDNFNDPDGRPANNTAPVLLSKIDNTKPFTFISKVTPSFLDTYDAGAIYVYLNKEWWLKFAFERDERKQTRIVSVRTTETSDDNNHDAVDNASVYMKVSSDTKVIGFYYSLDKERWQLVRVFHNDYPAEIWLGLSAQSPVGNGTSATFEERPLDLISVKDFRMGI